MLELGCGAGFTGIALLNNPSLSFSRLVMTDHHPKVISTLQSNLEANFPNSSQNGRVEVKVLDWADYACDPGRSEEECDLVIGADIVFDNSVIPQLVKCLDKLNRPAVLASCIRDELTDNVFRQNLIGTGLKFDYQTLANPFDTELNVPLHLYCISGSRERLESQE